MGAGLCEVIVPSCPSAPSLDASGIWCLPFSSDMCILQLKQPLNPLFSHALHLGSSSRCCSSQLNVFHLVLVWMGTAAVPSGLHLAFVPSRLPPRQGPCPDLDLLPHPPRGSACASKRVLLDVQHCRHVRCSCLQGARLLAEAVHYDLAGERLCLLAGSIAGVCCSVLLPPFPVAL